VTTKQHQEMSSRDIEIMQGATMDEKRARAKEMEREGHFCARFIGWPIEEAQMYRCSRTDGQCQAVIDEQWRKDESARVKSLSAKLKERGHKCVELRQTYPPQLAWCRQRQCPDNFAERAREELDEQIWEQSQKDWLIRHTLDGHTCLEFRDGAWEYCYNDICSKGKLPLGPELYDRTLSAIQAGGHTCTTTYAADPFVVQWCELSPCISTIPSRAEQQRLMAMKGAGGNVFRDRGPPVEIEVLLVECEHLLPDDWKSDAEKESDGLRAFGADLEAKGHACVKYHLNWPVPQVEWCELPVCLENLPKGIGDQMLDAKWTREHEKLRADLEARGHTCVVPLSRFITKWCYEDPCTHVVKKTYPRDPAIIEAILNKDHRVNDPKTDGPAFNRELAARFAGQTISKREFKKCLQLVANNWCRKTGFPQFVTMLHERVLWDTKFPEDGESSDREPTADAPSQPPPSEEPVPRKKESRREFKGSIAPTKRFIM